MLSSFESVEVPQPSKEFQWWHRDSPATGIAQPLQVRVDSLMEKEWYSIRRVSPGSEPHQAKFCRPWNTIMIFDRGSYVLGERKIDDLRNASPSPLDIGVDVAPAHSKFESVAKNGSNVTCNLVSFGEDLPAEIFGQNSFHGTLRPSFNLRGELLLPLAARLRDLCRVDSKAIDDLYVESVLVLLVREIFLAQGAAAPQRHVGGLSSKAQRIIREFFEDNLDSRVDLDSLANQVGISRFHFTRAFKTSFGIPPHKYLLKLRIRKATELLEQTDMSITEIALGVGFSCSSEFSRAFKMAMDCAPREFRIDRKMLEKLSAA